MDVPQLKLLAGLVRGLLEQHNVPVGHSQSLDLIAAIPGLRNWPEVNAFPDRVAACELNSSTAARLAHRLRSRHNVELTPPQLIAALSPPGSPGPARSTPPQIWPTGPAPGVYITTSQEAIDALLQRYGEATDGELVYAEAAGSGWQGAIDLGEYGLSSNGLSRVPSGTLLVVGPLELNQQSWKSSAEKLEWACIRADLDGHRVAVLLDTPAPELMFKDVALMVRSAASDGDDWDKALTGIVTADGVLQPRVPFVQEVAAPVAAAVHAPTDVLPSSVLTGLQQALARRQRGLVVLGCSLLEEHWAIDLIAALLPMTASLGPAARIKARTRTTPAKDMMVPDSVKVLPVLPSIESAFAHGYRRMIVQPGYTDTEALLEYGDEVLFLMGAYGMEATNSFLEAARSCGFDLLRQLMEKLVAAVGVGVLQLKGRELRVGDLFAPQGAFPPAAAKFGEVQDFVYTHRSVRWEDELAHLLDSRQVTLAAAKKALKDERAVSAFFAARGKKSPVHDSREAPFARAH